MNRPICESHNGEDCERPATWVVVFVDDSRARFSCAGYRDEWGKHGRGVILAIIKGFADPAPDETSRAGMMGRAAGLSAAKKDRERAARKREKENPIDEIFQANQKGKS